MKKKAMMNHQNKTGKRSPGCKPLSGLLAGVALMGLAGCAAVGPDYTPPDTKAPNTWHSGPADGAEAGSVNGEALAAWWQSLHDPVLSGLIERALQGNLDLAEARGRVREARARRGISQAGFFPTLETSASATKSRGSENTGSGRESRLYAAGFDAGWEIDLFGGVRRSVEAADADLAASVEDLHDVRVSLVAETALNYLDVRTFQARLSVAKANIKAQAETYGLVRSRFEAGLIDELAVQQSRYNLENSRSQVPSLQSGLEEAQNRLAVLSGLPPGAIHHELIVPKPIPVPPVTVAVGIPAEVLRRRPDIRRAERQLAAQSARIGVAVADLYPKFRLSGAIGLESVSESDLFTAASRTWRIGPDISWNIFDAGAIRGNIEVQSALQEQALVQYEAAVLAALEEVENAITAFAQEQLRRNSLLSATQAARRAMLLAQDRYAAGLVDFSNVLDAQRSLLSFEDNLTSSEGTVTVNLVRLYKALGGGWSSLSTAASTKPDNTK